MDSYFCATMEAFEGLESYQIDLNWQLGWDNAGIGVSGQDYESQNSTLESGPHPREETRWQK